jgi:hypothetical protein
MQSISSVHDPGTPLLQTLLMQIVLQSLFWLQVFDELLEQNPASHVA